MINSLHTVFSIQFLMKTVYLSFYDDIVKFTMKNIKFFQHITLLNSALLQRHLVKVKAPPQLV